MAVVSGAILKVVFADCGSFLLVMVSVTIAEWTYPKYIHTNGGKSTWVPCLAVLRGYSATISVN